MGEILVAVIGLVGTFSTGLLFSHPTAMHVVLSWRALYLGLLAAWLIGKGVAASLALTWFPAAFVQGTTDTSLIMSIAVWEGVVLACIVIFVTIRHSRNNPTDREPLAEIKKHEVDRQRWMKDMGE